MATVLTEISGALERAKSLAPALVVLDDLDALAPAESEDGGVANTQAGEIAEHVRDLLEKMGHHQARAEALLRRAEATMGQPEGEEGAIAPSCAAVSSAVGVVVTAKDPSMLSACLRQAGVIDSLLEIPPLDAKSRASIFMRLLREYSPTPPSFEIDVHSIVAKMEGCRPGDIETVISRALHAAVSRHLQPAPAETGLQVGELEKEYV